MPKSPSESMILIPLAATRNVDKSGLVRWHALHSRLNGGNHSTSRVVNNHLAITNHEVTFWLEKAPSRGDCCMQDDPVSG